MKTTRWMQFMTESGHPVVINMDEVKRIRPFTIGDGVYIDDVAVICNVEMLLLALNVETLS